MHQATQKSTKSHLVKNLDILADQENIYRTQVEFVEEWKRRESFFSWVHACIELQRPQLACGVLWWNQIESHHDCLALVLNDVT